MSYNVYLCRPFKRSVKLLDKRFPHVKESLPLDYSAPHTTPVFRLDEVKAARQPVLCDKG